MQTLGQKRVVINLIRVPDIGKCGRGKTGSGVKSGRLDSWRSVSWYPTEGRVVCYRIDGFDRLQGIRMIPVVAHPETIEQSRRESMVFLEGGDLPLGDGLLQDIIEYVRLCQGRVIVHVGAEEAILLRDLLVDSGGEVVFADDLLPCKDVISHTCTGRRTR